MFSRIFDLLPDAATLTRASDGVVIRVNERFTDITGYPRDQLEGRNAENLGCWLDPEQWTEAGRLLSPLEEPRQFRTRIHRRDGTVVALDVALRVVNMDSAPCWLATAREVHTLPAAAPPAPAVRTSSAICADDLRHVIDFTAIQELMNSFYRLTGIGMGIVDQDGNILVATGWQEICTRFHRIHPETRAHCIESDLYLSRNLQGQKYTMYKCKNNMWDMATPIVVEGVHIANLFLGQFLFEDEEPDVDTFRRQAERYGFDSDDYLAALGRIPRWSRETVRTAMDFYTDLARLVGEMNYRNLTLARTLADRRRAEAALQESEQKFAVAFHSAPSILIISTIEEGRFVEVNETFERVMGFTRDETIGRTSVELGIWNATERNAFLETLQREGKVRDFEGRYRARNGGTVYGLVSAEIVDLGDNRRLLTVVNDITDRKKMEEEIEILNTDLAARAAELERANRDLEAFSYTVSHDLRSPLTGIGGYCELIADTFGDLLDEHGNQYLRQISLATESMNDLITTILNFTRLPQKALHRRRVDMSAVAASVAEKLRQREPARNADISIAPGMEVDGDAGLLAVVMDNLLGNAWKYTAEVAPPRIEVGMTDTRHGTACYVRDNGPGFEEEDAQRIFRPFERLENSSTIPGHGIGLATVMRIVQRHGGTVWAESAPGRGATFYFTIPGASV